MLDAILDENVHNIQDDELSPEAVKDIKHMIMAGHAPALTNAHDRSWLYEVCPPYCRAALGLWHQHSLQ